jgi:alginate O-acetyltransferase complex protein AlgI
MLFNSNIFFFLFLPLTLLVYFFFNKKRLIVAGKAWLVLASLCFYSYWNPIYLPLLLISIVVNYRLGIYLGRDNISDKNAFVFLSKKFSRKGFLTAGIVLNLGLLGYFKYTDFFLENVNLFAGTSIVLPNLVLPLAISFFTFQQIAYLVDSYRGTCREYDFLNYSLFAAFFPQLIAGPIVHHKEMMPQFAGIQNKAINWRNIASGLSLFSIGMFKKVVIADSFAVWANAGFDNTQILTFFDAWGTSLSYTFQLYFDFSGYTDMALGSAMLFNIKLPLNFNSPYKAVNIRDFWQRWHITLSRWLRDYLYIPIGGNRMGKTRMHINLFITFLLGGLWHGAGWTFIIWGAMHGAGSIIHRAWRRTGIAMPTFFAWLLTFLFINSAWVFFRAKTFVDALNVLKSMAGFSGVKISEQFANLFNYMTNWNIYSMESDKIKFICNIQTLEYIIMFSFVCFMLPNSVQISGRINYQGTFSLADNKIYKAVLAGIILGISILTITASDGSEFLYFNF